MVQESKPKQMLLGTAQRGAGELCGSKSDLGPALCYPSTTQQLGFLRRQGDAEEWFQETTGGEFWALRASIRLL